MLAMRVLAFPLDVRLDSYGDEHQLWRRFYLRKRLQTPLAMLRKPVSLQMHSVACDLATLLREMRRLRLTLSSILP